MNKTKKTALTNGWTLLAHETISVYVNMDNPNKFCIHDWDDDLALTLTSEEDSVEVHRNTYNVITKISISDRTITFLHEPNEDED
ncbi:hypothetical protein ACZ11_07590 [Lysinibacillus xylanilyticus]|uniref:Uncharacterized protein n=1 Tax=Lysinibacillus xylanilyticus TaxID=582475 RepID=A0A0K9FBU1_9BACI|nr:hypothetical protein [Lysinibacillus xylanilyticus]KMY32024.1 hypothetical protein ACZ11_07590 [Lysinibacillus xylanilyticus]